MTCTDSLNYPFDCDYILKNKKSLKRGLLSAGTDFQKIRIALLSGSTIGYIKDIIELFLLKNAIQPEFFEGEYNRFYENVMFENGLYDFKPDIVFIHTSNKNISDWENLENEFEKYKSVWDKLAENNLKVIQNNFEMTDYRVLGNKDIYDGQGKLNFIHKLNSKMYEYAQTHTGFYINDLNYLSALTGLEKWHNPIHWYMYKYALDISVIPVLAHSVANIIKSVYGKNKKTIMLDLDNTLWGGVIGDIGAENIELGMETPMGEAYLEFHKYLKELSDNGIVLNIISKNNENAAFEGLNSSKSFLKPDDFICKKINWLPKSENIKATLKELNLLTESAVFVDDNPVERDEVAANCENINIINSSDIMEFIKFIDRNGYFERTNISEDDKKRIEYYKQNAKRIEAQSNFSNYEDYLRSLEMTSRMVPFGPANIERAVQLFNKTNQFNVTQKKYLQEDIEKIADSYTLAVELDDKFGKNGIVSVLIGMIDGDVLILDNWVLSCRVFKRNLEQAIFSRIVSDCKNKGIDKIKAKFVRSQKNGYIENLFDNLGFDLISEENGTKNYEYLIKEDIKQDIIKITEDKEYERV